MRHLFTLLQCKLKAKKQIRKFAHILTPFKSTIKWSSPAIKGYQLQIIHKQDTHRHV